jgi:hypothetical protein
MPGNFHAAQKTYVVRCGNSSNASITYGRFFVTKG